MSERATGRIGSTTPGHFGADAAGVALGEVTIDAAWNLQGDPARAAFVASAQQLFAVPLPLVPNTTKRGSGLLVLWLGPRSWLLIESSPARQSAALTDFAVRRDALNAQGGALFDVSASRVAYAIRGPLAATVLAKSCPLDFHPDVFPVGGCAQSLFGRVNALIYRQDASPTFVMLVARSLARDSWRLLCGSSAQYGYEVAAPRPRAEAR